MAVSAIESGGLSSTSGQLVRDTITAAWIQEILTEIVLKQDWIKPSWEDLENLAIHLNVLQRYFESCSLSKKLSSDLEAIAKAFQTIDQLAPLFIQECWAVREFASSKPVNSDHIDTLISEHSTNLRLASQVIARARRNGLLRLAYGGYKNKRHWKEFAFEFAGLLTELLAKNNPDRRLGYSTGGPASRWVHLLIPKLTGETPSLETVSLQLKVAARNSQAEEKRARALIPPQDSDSEVPF